MQAPTNGTDTSNAAARSVAGLTPQLRAMVRARIGQSPSGLTCDEIEKGLDMKHQTASARIRELVLSGDVVDTGQRRLTRSGRSARVYKVVA